MADAYAGCGRRRRASTHGGSSRVAPAMRPHLLLLVAALAAPAFASGQTAPLWRSVDISRQLRDTLPQRIRVQYGVGRVDVRGANDRILYSMHLRYDETRDRSNRVGIIWRLRRGGGAMMANMSLNRTRCRRTSC